jgi:hypothetical protein
MDGESEADTQRAEGWRAILFGTEFAHRLRSD